MAWSKFRKDKRSSRAIDMFAYDLELNLACLSTDLNHRTYHHGNYQAVIVYEKKRRDLAVATVRDRIVHRLLYDYLVDIYDKSFDPDVWSCRTGKGLHRCLDRTQKLLRRHSDGYVWRADIAKFFDNVDHSTLLNCLDRKIGQDETARWLCNEVISSYNALQTTDYRLQTTDYRLQTTDYRLQTTGIPIGNLTSQIFSNIYLNEFDRFVRHVLKPQAYIRYGDDFVLFWATRSQAYHSRQRAQDFLFGHLSLSLNPKNDIVTAANGGLKFLGHAVTNNFAVVDKHTTRSILDKIDWHNAASYKAMSLVSETKYRLDWILLEKDVDI